MFQAPGLASNTSSRAGSPGGLQGHASHNTTDSFQSQFLPWYLTETGNYEQFQLHLVDGLDQILTLHFGYQVKATSPLIS